MSMPSMVATTASAAVYTSYPTPIVGQVAGWSSLGCYLDSIYPNNALSVSSYNTSTPVTPTLCGSYCSSYNYFGVESGVDCFCGDTLQVTNTTTGGPWPTAGGGVPTASSACTAACEGDDTALCGGEYLLNLYTNTMNMPIPTTTPSFPTSPSSAPTSAPFPAGNGTTPAPISSVLGWTYYGCYGLTTSIGATMFTDPLMTAEKCLADCTGFLYAGLQGTSCYCTAQPANGTFPQLSNGVCNVPCAGDPTEVCGGPSGPLKRQRRQTSPNIKLSVYINTPVSAVQSTSTIYATKLITFTSCAPTVTQCPYRSHASVLTTSTPVSYVVYATSVITISSCAATIVDCPYRTHPIMLTTVVPIFTLTSIATITAVPGSAVATGAPNWASPKNGTTAPISSATTNRWGWSSLAAIVSVFLFMVAA